MRTTTTCDNDTSNIGGLHDHPRPKKKQQRSDVTSHRGLKVLAALTLAASAVATKANGEIGYSTTATAPVYLMRNSHGAAFTAEVNRHPVTGELRVKKRPVTPREIASLEAEGVTLAAIPDPDDLIGSGGEAGEEGRPDQHKQGGLVPSVPSSFTIIRLYGYTYGGFWTNGTRPSGRTTHWSSFSLRSGGFGRTVEHVAHALFFDGTDPIHQGLKGNGMLIGKSSSPGTGCGPYTSPDYYGEIESFWAGGNALYPSSCSPAGLLMDGSTHNFTLHASTGQWVTYWIASNGSSFASEAVDTAPQRPYWDPNKGGCCSQ